jgi:hypothetical protein
MGWMDVVFFLHSLFLSFSQHLVARVSSAGAEPRVDSVLDVELSSSSSETTDGKWILELRGVLGKQGPVLFVVGLQRKRACSWASCCDAVHHKRRGGYIQSWWEISS